MWSIRPEMTHDECKKCLRRLESDAYGSMVSVLRAQGSFTNDKQKLLQELAKVLHISNERHRSEVRRVVNDDMLATIAEQLNGPNTGTDWAIESRRTIPLMPRLKARSAFTTLANSLSLTITTADEEKPNRDVIPKWHGNLTVAATETESQSEMQMEENLSVHTKLCNLENNLDISKILKKTSNLAKDEKIGDKDVVSKVFETSKVSRLSEKRKLSPLLTAPPNKVLMVSKTTPLDYNILTVENEQTLSQVPPAMHHQNIALIPSTVNEISVNSNSKESTTVSKYLSGHTAISSNKPVVITTISMCTSNASESMTLASSIENKVSTKTVPVVSSSTLNIPRKEQLKNKDTQSQDIANNIQKNQRSENINSNPSCNKRSATSITHKAIMSSTPHQRTVTVYPDTTISSGPGPPQIKSSETLMCKKLSSEQIAIFNQSTAKTGATINSKKVVNIPHYPNTKLNSKTNVIVIQKGHTKGITLSHAGKELLGKVIIGGKNLCVMNQHNANSVSVQPHHISLNNGNQTKTVLSTANSSQNAESVKTNSGKTAIMSMITTHLRHNLMDKNKVLSQFFDSPDGLNLKSKTVIPNIDAHLPKEKYNNDANTINRESSLKTDIIDTSMLEEKKQYRNKDINESTKSQEVNSSDSSNRLESKKVLVKQKQFANTMQDDAKSNIRIADSDEKMDAFGATLDTTNINLENFQYLVDNDNRCLGEIKEVDGNHKSSKRA